MIHPSAVIHPEARLADDVSIGPFCQIGPGVEIGPGTELASNVVVQCNTRIGARCRIASFAALGGDPEVASYDGHPTFLELGDDNWIREFVTLNRGCFHEGVTRIGSHCMFMKGSHVAHDCAVGNHVTVAALAALAGHCTVEDRVTLGGLAGFHQFVRIGTLAMVGGTAGVMQDVPPYCLVAGPPPALVYGLNIIGLKRNGVAEAGITALKHAFRIMYRRGLLKDQAVKAIADEVEQTPEVRHFLEFVSADSRRGLCQAERD